jgi:guanylate kinase
MSTLLLDTQKPSTGSLFVVAAPSGAGKTSIVREVLKQRPGLELSVSFTTRAPRPGETNGVDYFFVTPEQFEQKIKDCDLLEWAKVHGNFYGTSGSWVASQMSIGKDIVLEIDWQGARQVAEHFADKVSIFILPPSLVQLKARLVARGQDSELVIERRLTAASEEIAHAQEFDYVIINQDFNVACQSVCAIVDSARLRSGKTLASHGDLYQGLIQDKSSFNTNAT